MHLVRIIQIIQGDILSDLKNSSSSWKTEKKVSNVLEN